MERRMRKMSRSGQRPCRAAVTRQYRESGSIELRPGQQRLYSVPFPGAAPDKPDSREILRLARRLQRRAGSEEFLEARRAQARRDFIHTFSGWDRAQESHAG